MNEELIQKIFSESCLDKYAEISIEGYMAVKKFTELIVKECVQVVNAADDSCEDYYGSIIKDHFGIE